MPGRGDQVSEHDLDLLDVRPAEVSAVVAGGVHTQATKLRIVVVRGDVGATGLSLHDQLGHSMLPAGLVAEIRALVHPPLTWDVALARWFDEHFPAVERQRSYARPSRRQAANPAVPMSGYRRPEEAVARRTFGVVLDTSGSGPTSCSAGRSVRSPPMRRRAAPGCSRASTCSDAPDFPATGPILVITDGGCDVVRMRREHAFLVPAGAMLPFTPRGPLFRMA